MTEKKMHKDLKVRLMTEADADAVARLHRTRINLGFLSTLGHSFLKNLYLGMLRYGEAIIYVAESAGEVIGFAAATPSVAGLYKRVIRAQRWKFTLILIPRLFSPKVIKNCYETFRYSSREDEQDLPQAEFLSIAVAEEYAGQGLGKVLIQRVLADLWAQGVPAVRVMVLAALNAANAFYPKLGFRLVRTVEIHGRPTHIYIKSKNPQRKDTCR